MQLGGGSASPIVALGSAGEPQLAPAGMEQCLPQFGFGIAERDRLEPAAILSCDDQAQMVGPDDARFDDADRARRDARRGPAGAIGARALDRIAPQRADAPRRQDRVDQQRLVAARACGVFLFSLRRQARSFVANHQQNSSFCEGR